MIKTFNLSAHPMDMDKFNGSSEELYKFIKQHSLDGIELIQNLSWDKEIIPAHLVKGLHMRYWPIWLDFWNSDKNALNRKFGSTNAWVEFYGGEDRQAIVHYYKRELELARQIGVKYVVFHVGNVEPEHCFNYNFSYTTEEVITASIELINEILKDFQGQLDFLMENLWWPGLNFMDVSQTNRLIKGINYERKGFMLDIGHLMNTNIELASEEKAVDYICAILQNHGELINYIKGIHLNSSLSGSYVKNHIGIDAPFTGQEDFMYRYIEAYKHILHIDRHVPFSSKSIKKVIDMINPKYLVYEVLTDDRATLEKFISQQNKTLE